MKNNNLETRRQKLLNELDRINRQIDWVQKTMDRIASQIATRQQTRAKAA